MTRINSAGSAGRARMRASAEGQSRKSAGVPLPGLSEMREGNFTHRGSARVSSVRGAVCGSSLFHGRIGSGR